MQPNIISQLVGAGALQERIYGRRMEGDTTTAAADAKIDPNAPQVFPGSEAETAAADAVMPDEAPGDEGESFEAELASTPTVGVDMPVSFLLMSLVGARGMVDTLDEMSEELATRYGETAIPVLNDVIFKIRSAHEMLEALVSESSATEDDLDLDDASEPALDGEPEPDAEAADEPAQA